MMKINSISPVILKPLKTNLKKELNKTSIDKNAQENSLNILSNYNKSALNLSFKGVEEGFEIIQADFEKVDKKIGFDEKYIKANKQARYEVYDALIQSGMSIDNFYDVAVLKRLVGSVRTFNKDFALELIKDGIIPAEQIPHYISFSEGNLRSEKTIRAKKELYEALKESNFNFMAGGCYPSPYYSGVQIIKLCEEANKGYIIELVKKGKLPTEFLEEKLAFPSGVSEEEKLKISEIRMAKLHL